jgi:hypothetical protein
MHLEKMTSKDDTELGLHGITPSAHDWTASIAQPFRPLHLHSLLASDLMLKDLYGDSFAVIPNHWSEIEVCVDFLHGLQQFLT